MLTVGIDQSDGKLIIHNQKTSTGKERKLSSTIIETNPTFLTLTKEEVSTVEKQTLAKEEEVFPIETLPQVLIKMKPVERLTKVIHLKVKIDRRAEEVNSVREKVRVGLKRKTLGLLVRGLRVLVRSCIRRGKRKNDISLP
uniref:Uncharacterized protein n=1 Tax=Cacopsylla melanoneura TaxID=428564 RepID=A0A8D9BH32_9HEMI